ncbi:MAG: DUF2089 domain-containing protein [Chloroflexota bacterium]|nr:DUF2089 domain-containing protein [Chloroflexota bacterium]
MHTYSGRCPVCGQGMAVTRLHCRSCDTFLEGSFALSRFASLTQEQFSFLETFIRCQGKLSWVGEELKLSYPTVRNRLNDVIQALGFEIMDEPPADIRQRDVRNRQAILENLASGGMSTEEAIDLLQPE